MKTCLLSSCVRRGVVAYVQLLRSIPEQLGRFGQPSASPSARHLMDQPGRKVEICACNDLHLDSSFGGWKLTVPERCASLG